MKNYAFLEPISVGNTTLKNRVLLGAMAKYLCDEDNFVTDDYIAHYTAIAQGGAALITPGIMVIDPDWPYISQRQAGLYHDKFIPKLQEFTQSIHEAGAKVCFQLWHAGLAGTMTADSPGISVADLSLEDIARIQDRYVEAAVRAKKAGADAVDFHMAHTYLPAQFLSPHFNRRTDQYGADTIENATRFSVEILRRLRKKLCGPDDPFFITSKINGYDFVTGGTTPQWAAKAARILEQEGVAMITVNGGGALVDLTKMSDDGKEKEGWKVADAAVVKNAVSIPVAASGSIRRPEYAHRIIRQGKCDMVSLARGLFAEPQWVEKAQQGREDEMRYCISCMFCFTPVKAGQVGCSVNPFAKRERAWRPLVQDGANRVVAIIGAGPAGLEAAVVLAERGFRPVIFEKEKEIGGSVALAAMPPNKSKIRWMIEYYQRQIRRLSIDLRLGEPAHMDTLKELQPEVIIVASGGTDILPPIPGLDRPNVLSPRQILCREEILTGRDVVVLGGGLTGLETAQFLDQEKNHVTVVDMLCLDQITGMENELALRYCRERGITLVQEEKVLAVDENVVRTQSVHSQEEQTLPYDYCITSFGVTPQKLSLPFEEITSRVVTIGDAKQCRKISSAVEEGNTVARNL